MAVTELIFPRVKTDPASLQEIERDWPVLSKGLTDPNPGLLHAYRGWILTADGQNVRDEHREFLLFEWNKAESFHVFVGSEQFAAFAGSIRHLVTGPPTLQLFETNDSPRHAASASAAEIIRVGIAESENVEAALKVWETLSNYLSRDKEAKIPVTYGKSLNLEEDTVVGIIGWHSSKAQSPISQEKDFMDALNSLKSLGKVSRITVDTGAMELGAQ